MNKILIGLSFVFIDVNVSLGNVTVSLIPDFVGYIFLFLGLKQMQEENYWFARTKSLAVVMLLYSAFSFLC